MFFRVTLNPNSQPDNTARGARRISPLQKLSRNYARLEGNRKQKWVSPQNKCR
jgi:hypothetical protein